MSTLFISHSRYDRLAAERLIIALRERGYRSIFLDFDPNEGIAGGDDWERAIYRNIRIANGILLLCSPDSVQSRWCFAEITQSKALGKAIFPLKLAECQIDRVLTDRQIIDLTCEPWNLDPLWHGLRIAGLDPRDDFGWDPTRSPYPGLNVFERDDAAVYFGRLREVSEIFDALEQMRRVRDSRFLVIYGASGSGKSSLLRAGVIPRVAKDDERWVVVPPFRPEDDPISAAAMAFAEAFREYDASADWKDLRDRFLAAAIAGDGAQTSAFIELSRDLLAVAGRRDASVLVVIDQFEELVDSPNPGGADKFLRLVRRTIQSEGSPVIVATTLRSDFFAVFQNHPQLRGLPFSGYPLGPMPLTRIAEVIEGPADRVGLRFEPGLVERLVQDTGTDDALPLLAFALRRLYETRPDADASITLGQYETVVGGIDGSVARVADLITTSPEATPAEEEALHSAFLRLVRLGERNAHVRRAADWQELPVRAHPILERLVDGRLLVSRTDRGQRRLEVTHEALFRTWPRLREWLAGDKEFLLWRRRLQPLFEVWQTSRRKEDVMLRGEPLSEAQRWLRDREADLNAEEKAFIQESARQAAQDHARRERSRRNIVLMLAIGLALTLTLTAIAFWQLRQKRLALRQYEQMSDVVLVENLIERSRRLWPPRTEKLQDIDAWLAEARQLASRPGQHRAALHALRQRALPFTEEDRLTDQRAKEDLYRELYLDLRLKKEELSQLKLDPSEGFAAEKATLEREIAALERDGRLTERVFYRFSDKQDTWRHQVLAELVRDLDTFTMLIDDVGHRRDVAASLRKISIDDHLQSWEVCRRAVADDPVYRGLKLTPQVGLVPLGRNQDSGLWEFWHVLSGKRPRWIGDIRNGRPLVLDESGMVLILVPAAKFQMGAQRTNRSLPNYDPHASSEEEPVHEVVLDAFFISKYEMTQQQWFTATGQSPSQNTASKRLEGKRATPRNPVNNVDWAQASDALLRLDLILPTEAQWEYTARAETNTPWWTGWTVASIQGSANVADAFAEKYIPYPVEKALHDGYAEDAPVGLFKANRFGLHDTIGNLWEWCRDRYSAYTTPPRPGDGLREDPASRTVVDRGGGFSDLPSNARSSLRYGSAPGSRDPYLGVRPAKRVEP